MAGGKIVRSMKSTKVVAQQDSVEGLITCRYYPRLDIEQAIYTEIESMCRRMVMNRTFGRDVWEMIVDD